MAESKPVETPAPKPGQLIWVGRFKNRPAIVTKVYLEGEKATPKYEYEPIPKGRKKPKVRNLLPYRSMNQEDSDKWKKVYDEETEKIRAKAKEKKAAAVLVMRVLARADLNVVAVRG